MSQHTTEVVRIVAFELCEFANGHAACDCRRLDRARPCGTTEQAARRIALRAASLIPQPKTEEAGQ